MRELGIDPFSDKLNPHGGAIALGHPYGMTGARIMCTLLNDLETMDKTIGLETMCVGGGQGMAMLVERALGLDLGALALVLALGSSVVWGVADFSGGSLTRRLPTLAGDGDLAGAPGSSRCSWRSRSAATSGRGRSCSGCWPGIGGGVGLASFYRALSIGTMSVVSPVAACGAVVPFAIAIATGERPSHLAIGGAVFALGGAVLASVDERRSGRPSARARWRLPPAPRWRSVCSSTSSGSASREGDALSTLFGARVGSLAFLVGRVRVRRDTDARTASLARRGRGGGAGRRERERAVRVRERPRPALAGLGARLAVPGRHRPARPRPPRRTPDATQRFGVAVAMVGIVAIAAALTLPNPGLTAAVRSERT